MMPRGFRLANQTRIATIARQGRSAADGPILFKWLPREIQAAKASKFAFVASKKHFPKAVDRNRAKRIAREGVRFYLTQLSPGYDILIMYRFRPETLDVETIQLAIGRILAKNRLIMA